MTMNKAHDAVGDVDALKRLERFGGLKLREELTTLFLQEAPARIASARAALAVVGSGARTIEGVLLIGVELLLRSHGGNSFEFCS